MNERQQILYLTGGGLDVFTHYLGDVCLKRIFKNPFREDSRPSCHLYANKNTYGQVEYYLQDFGDSSFCGNCFAIVARLCNMNVKTAFKDILKVIDKEFCLGLFNNPFPQTEIIYKRLVKRQKPETSSTLSFQYKEKPFTMEELCFWQRYGIGQDTLEHYHVASLSACRMSKENGKKFTVYGTAKYPAFGYLFNNNDGIKIYSPCSKNRFLYAGVLPRPYIFGWEQLPPQGEYIFITGGEKDVMSLAAHGFHAICLNSETAKLPDSLMQQLAGRFRTIVILYDMDATGQSESKKRVQEYTGKYNVRRVLLPLSGEKSEKDISDFFRLGHTAEQLATILNSERL